MVNVVRDTHPDRAAVTGWFLAHGFAGTDDGRLRKRVGDRSRTSASSRPAVPEPAGRSRPTSATGAVRRRAGPCGRAPAGRDAGRADLGPGHEESGGYVDPEQHRY